MIISSISSVSLTMESTSMFSRSDISLSEDVTGNVERVRLIGYVRT